MKTRQIVLDTETTGLDPDLGHRIIEIGCVELVNRRRTDNTFQQYLNPERDIDEGALEVHGISREFLADKPRFGDVVDEIGDFLEGAELIIHNAPFDVAFLDYELSLLDGRKRKVSDLCQITDSLALARHKHPGQKNSLDALCRRYEVDNSARTLHGALLDAEILADVFLLMTGGQTALFAADGDEENAAAADTPTLKLDQDRPKLKVVRATVEEMSAHEAWLDRLDGATDNGSIWRSLEGSA